MGPEWLLRFSHSDRNCRFSDRSAGQALHELAGIRLGHAKYDEFWKILSPYQYRLCDIKCHRSLRVFGAVQGDWPDLDLDCTGKLLYVFRQLCSYDRIDGQWNPDVLHEFCCGGTCRGLKRYRCIGHSISQLVSIEPDVRQPNG
jgi:hypothetical protein